MDLKEEKAEREELGALVGLAELEAEELAVEALEEPGVA